MNSVPSSINCKCPWSLPQAPVGASEGSDDGIELGDRLEVEEGIADGGIVGLREESKR